ncbi:MAG: hypothetical protein AB8D52_04415 [Gammaproteobacteria bacterium]
MWFVIALSLLYGPYNAKVQSVIDAETLRLEVAVWPGEEKLIEIGVLSVETPSLDGECDAEKLLAEEAAELTRAFVGKQVRLTDVRRLKGNDKVYAKIRNIQGKSLRDSLIESGYGKPYDKDKKVSWCP